MIKNVDPKELTDLIYKGLKYRLGFFLPKSTWNIIYGAIVEYICREDYDAERNK